MKNKTKQQNKKETSINVSRVFTCWKMLRQKTACGWRRRPSVQLRPRQRGWCWENSSAMLWHQMSLSVSDAPVQLPDIWTLVAARGSKWASLKIPHISLFCPLRGWAPTKCTQTQSSPHLLAFQSGRSQTPGMLWCQETALPHLLKIIMLWKYCFYCMYNIKPTDSRCSWLLESKL